MRRGSKASLQHVACPARVGRAADPVPAVEPPISSDILAILYTSGTTGPAKGVLCPHAQYHWWGVHSAEVLGVGAGDVLCTTLPLFHINALNTFAQASLAGARVVFEPRFSASGSGRRCSRASASVVYLLGAMVPILLAQPARRRSARTACASASGRACRRRRGGVPRAHRRPAARRLRLDRDQLRHRQRARFAAPRLHGLAAAGLRGARGRRARRRVAGRARRASWCCAPTSRSPSPAATSASPRRPSRPGATSGSTPATAWCATPTAPSASSTASRTRSAAAARTSRRGRSSRCCMSHPAVAAVAVYPVRSELAEDEVMARRGRCATARRSSRPSWRASAKRVCRTSRCRATSSWSPTCRAPRTARCRSTSCASAACTAGRVGPAGHGRGRALRWPILERRARDPALARGRALAGGQSRRCCRRCATARACTRACTPPCPARAALAADLAALPFTLKDDLRAAQEAASATSRSATTRPRPGRHRPGDLVVGHDRRPLYYALTARDVEMFADAIANVWFTAGIRRDDVVAHLVGLPMVAGGLPYADGFRRIGATLCWLGGFPTERILREMRRLRVTALLATTSFALHLAEQLGRGRPRDGMPRPDKVLGGGEPGLGQPESAPAHRAAWALAPARDHGPRRRDAVDVGRCEPRTACTSTLSATWRWS